MAKKKEENVKAVETEEAKAKFQEKLTALLELGKKKKNILEYQEISDFFKDMNLDAEKFELVLDYLEHNGIDVLKMTEDDDADDIILDEEDEVELTEEIIDELLKTGKTKKKVLGFTSKAGNVFDSCLKYDAETNTISFDFDNPGEDAGDSAGAGVLDFASMDESATADINAEIEALHENEEAANYEAETVHENVAAATNHEAETAHENDTTVTYAENDNAE